MATNIKQTFRSESSVSITLASLADGSSATSSAIDNSSNADFDGELEVALTGAAGADSHCNVAILRSIDNTNFATAGETIGALAMSGTSTIREVFLIENLPPYFKVQVSNFSGAALDSTGSNHEVNFVGKQVTATTA